MSLEALKFTDFNRESYGLRIKYKNLLKMMITKESPNFANLLCSDLAFKDVRSPIMFGSIKFHKSQFGLIRYEY